MTVRAVHRGEVCEVTVEDTGSGIPPEHLPYVFERFYRVDPSRSREDGGTGIGLAIARSVVEAHGGWIWAESDEGAGSQFTFLVPLSPAPPSRPGGLRHATLGAAELESRARIQRNVKEEV